MALPEHEFNAVKTDVELLKRDVNAINGLLGRLDTAIDKIADVSNGIQKILAVHDQSIGTVKHTLDERKKTTEKEIELLHAKFSDMKDEGHRERKSNQDDLLRAIREQDNKTAREVEKLAERLNILEKWKWWVMGAAATIGFIISQMPIFDSFFHVAGGS